MKKKPKKHSGKYCKNCGIWLSSEWWCNHHGRYEDPDGWCADYRPVEEIPKHCEFCDWVIGYEDPDDHELTNYWCDLYGSEGWVMPGQWCSSYEPMGTRIVGR
jgi:hypothetical protein